MRIAFTLMAMFVAAAATPTFEVASIRLCPPNDNRQDRISTGPGSKDPERFAAQNSTLADLIEYAYRLKPNQYSFPAWMNDETFDVTAKVPLGVTPDECRIMLQNLLLERFDLKFHRENKDMPIYELMIAKSGVKLTASNEIPNIQPFMGVKVGSDGYPVLPPGNRPMTQVAPGGKATTRAFGETATDIAEHISSHVRRPVIDTTGLPGKYDYTLRFDLNADRAPGPTNSNEIGSVSDSVRGPSYVVALEEQLGLKLKPGRAPVPIFVVDSARKAPIEN